MSTISHRLLSTPMTAAPDQTLGKPICRRVCVYIHYSGKCVLTLLRPIQIALRSIMRLSNSLPDTLHRSSDIESASRLREVFCVKCYYIKKILRIGPVMRITVSSGQWVTNVTRDDDRSAGSSGDDAEAPNPDPTRHSFAGQIRLHLAYRHLVTSYRPRCVDGRLNLPPHSKSS
ncbi:hypothetical protein J6590_060511 [Homalodisca vitripennis]|nr:hypothetical protein J6590_060511 [Homalodisca vitripennis]